MPVSPAQAQPVSLFQRIHPSEAAISGYITLISGMYTRKLQRGLHMRSASVGQMGASTIQASIHTKTQCVNSTSPALAYKIANTFLRSILANWGMHTSTTALLLAKQTSFMDLELSGYNPLRFSCEDAEEALPLGRVLIRLS